MKKNETLTYAHEAYKQHYTYFLCELAFYLDRICTTSIILLSALLSS